MSSIFQTDGHEFIDQLTNQDPILLSFPLIDLVDRSVLEFLVVSEAGCVDFGAKSFIPPVWKVAKAHPKVQWDLPTVLFAMTIIARV